MLKGKTVTALHNFWKTTNYLFSECFQACLHHSVIFTHNIRVLFCIFRVFHADFGLKIPKSGQQLFAHIRMRRNLVTRHMIGRFRCNPDTPAVALQMFSFLQISISAIVFPLTSHSSPWYWFIKLMEYIYNHVRQNMTELAIKRRKYVTRGQLCMFKLKPFRGLEMFRLRFQFALSGTGLLE
jgi:hypothetical protein